MIKWPLDLESSGPVVEGMPYRRGGRSSTGSSLFEIVAKKDQGRFSCERYFAIGPEVKKVSNEAGDVPNSRLGV